MQPLFRPMEGHQLHHFNFHHLTHHHQEAMAAAAAAAAAAARMNSTPVSDDELDMDDSVSLSSNQDGSCNSPSSAAQLAENKGKLLSSIFSLLQPNFLPT